MARWFGIIIFSLSVLGQAGVALALDPKPLQCSGTLFEGKAKYNEEISGVKCLIDNNGDNICYLVADEKKGLQQISVYRTGKNTHACNPGPVIAKKRGLWCLKGKKPERDFEAIAANKNHLFITGSWGNRRKKRADQSPERWVLIRQKLSSADHLDGECEAVKRKNLKSFVQNSIQQLRPFIDVPLQCGGLNIEGLAFQNGQLFFGLRSPSQLNDGVALVVETSAAGIFSNRPSAQVHKLQFRIDGQLQKGIGIRALENVGDGRILIATGVAGATLEGLSGDGRAQIANRCMPGTLPYYRNEVYHQSAKLWSWTPGNDKLKFLGTVDGVYKGRKLEGLSILARQNGKLQLILAFDGIDNNELSPLALVEVEFD